MDDYGQFVSAEVIRFQRLLPGTAQEVWEHLTSPQWLAGWRPARSSRVSAGR